MTAFSAWGKLDPADGSVYPLVDHMLDVAATLLAVCRTRGIHRALSRLAGREMTETDLWRLAALAFLHDVGKANAGFQAKYWSAMGLPLPGGWPTASGHSDEAMLLFDPRLSGALAHLPMERLGAWGDGTFNLLVASISHHGRPAQTPLLADPAIWRPVAVHGLTYSPLETLAQIGQCVQRWFEPAFDDGPALPSSPHFAHVFAGLVQFADWLGSDRRFFPFSQPGEDRNLTAWSRAKQAIQSIGFDATLYRERLTALPSFCEVFGVPSPRPIQERMCDSTLGSLLILESETGSGKTEAALWRFAQLFHSGQVDGLYFALPTRVAASQLYERVLTFSHRLFGETCSHVPAVVRALAGYESADGQAIQGRLPNFKVLWADSPADQTAHLRWAAESSKRFLAAPLAVGTIDQALMGALQVRHVHMRHSLLARSLLVVDEVHASDAYMASLLAHLLKAHLAAGGHALLLSATLGSSARHLFQRVVSEKADLPSLEQGRALPYPSLTDGVVLTGLPESGRSKQVHWDIHESIDHPDAVAALAVGAAAQGAKVLIVRNTVPAALATFRAIERQALGAGIESAIFHVNGIRTVHHSRYSRQDRPQLDRAVEQQIGKDRLANPGPSIIVGTQTLEQSLDIDADFLITDLCPMDVLLQRVGRLHRHTRSAQERPPAFARARAAVLVPAGNSLQACLVRPQHGLGRFHDGGGVYPDLRILEATRRQLMAATSHQIPRDNRELVEQATHPQALAAIEEELGPAWRTHGQQVDGKEQASQTLARLNVLAFNQPFEDDQGNPLPFNDHERLIGSRLGAADYLVTFEPAVPGPFGAPVRELPIRQYLWPRDAGPQAQPSNVVALGEGGFSFSLADQTFRYSRLGLERVKQSEQEHSS